MSHSNAFNVAGWRYKPKSASLERPGESRRLTPQLNRLLLALLEAEDQTLEKEELIRTAWNRSVVSDDAVARAVSELRKILRTEENNDPITTLHGFGYRLELQQERRGNYVWFAGAIFAVILAASVAFIYWQKHPEKDALVQQAVTPMSVFSNLPVGHKYLPVESKLMYLNDSGHRATLLEESTGKRRTFAELGAHEHLAISADGSRAAWFQVEPDCSLVSTDRGFHPYRSRGSCLKQASRVLAWAPDGALLFAQLAGGRVTVQSFRDDDRKIQTAAATPCEKLRGIARSPLGRTYLACGTRHGDILFELTQDQLVERLKYRSIERFVVDKNESFYIVSAPHWKPGVTRYTPPGKFEFLQTGRVLELALNGNRLVLVRNFTNNDLMVWEGEKPEATAPVRFIEQGSVWTQAFSVDSTGALWQLDDRNGSLLLYRQNQPISAFSDEGLAYSFQEVQCLSVDAPDGIVDFFSPGTDGMHRARHDIATGTLLEVSQEIACPMDAHTGPQYPLALEAVPVGYTAIQHTYDRVNTLHYFLLERSSYADIAVIELPLTP